MWYLVFPSKTKQNFWLSVFSILTTETKPIELYMIFINKVHKLQ